MAQNIARKNEELSFDDSVKQNKRGEAILGRLTGPCADFIAPTRNGRIYDEEVWEKVFNSEIINEYFKNGGILGELDHPADRSETCMEKIAICMPEKPIKGEDGKLIATFDILDTPNGRIAYTLAKYGYKLGVSSRGTGDVYEDFNGQEHVDPDAYDFQAFDLVLLPAVKAARLKMVESVQQQPFKKALLEELNKSTEEARKIMIETLDNLQIDYKNESSEIAANSEAAAANDDGADVVKELQKSLKEQKALSQQVQALQEKLLVCNAKRAKIEEQLQRYKTSVINLSESARSVKALQAKVASLSEQLSKKDATIKIQQDRLTKLSEKMKIAAVEQKTLNESLSKKDGAVKEAEEKIKAIQFNSSKQIESLKENLEELKANSTIKNKEYTDKLSKANSLVERYQRIARVAVDRYITSKAAMLGVSSDEIKNKLSENYSFDDIDRVCENLQNYQLNISKLPFTVRNDRPVKMKVKESVEPIKLASRFDDEVDEHLLRLADRN